MIASETTPMIVARESSTIRLERLPDGIFAGKEIARERLADDGDRRSTGGLLCRVGPAAHRAQSKRREILRARIVVIDRVVVTAEHRDPAAAAEWRGFGERRGLNAGKGPHPLEREVPVRLRSGGIVRAAAECGADGQEAARVEADVDVRRRAPSPAPAARRAPAARPTPRPARRRAPNATARERADAPVCALEPFSGDAKLSRIACLAGASPAPSPASTEMAARNR